MTTIAAWDDEYARISRAASQLRTSNQHNQPHPSARAHQVRSVQAGLARLKSSLITMRNNGLMNSADVQRRIGLIDNLENQVDQTGGSSTGASGGGGGGGLGGGQMEGDLLGSDAVYSGGNQTLATQALRHQDEMIDDLAAGVSRLKDQTLMINDEANTQNQMLEGMDGDVESARYGLEAETMRALRLKEDQSVWRLYMIIAGLSVVLFMLIMSGLG
mmetsp:Transcript_22472/g.32883  ORF Transcript_22472/g.32883 Transcript_22472/m.32883 type:complete len:217 (-) Transcript_22472:571-1221(-)